MMENHYAVDGRSSIMTSGTKRSARKAEKRKRHPRRARAPPRHAVHPVEIDVSVRINGRQIMPLQVRYFASLRERMGRAGESLDDVNVASVAEIWARVSQNIPMPANTLVAVNREYADVDRIVKDGDEVAFFPPVTGG